MATKTEQFSELNRKNMEAAMKLAQMSIDNSQRIMAIQVDAAKKLFQESVESAKALASIKDPQQAIALRTQYAQVTAQQMIETARQISEIGNASRTQFSHMLTEQLTNGSKDMMETFQTFFTSLPGPSGNVVETMQKAMANATEAFEQIAQASATAFGNTGDKATAKKKK
ncbi:MAG: phasin family protein [Sterolibacterium sp.]|nr:phasin family protein [Sterolibacterium sp.]